MLRRAAPAAALVALACALSACGNGGSGTVPRGNPDARHGAAAVDAYASVELLRGRLIASSDSYYASGSAEDARQQLVLARAAYDALAPRVRANDPVVDREVVARFNTLARDLHAGIAPDHYRDLAGPLADQLMDGVSQALVPPPARSDRGVQAEALRRVTARLAATYDAASAGADPMTSRLAFEQAWGLWRRAQALTSLIKPNLGGQAGAVSGTLSALRGSAFPEGPAIIDSPPAEKVDNAGTKIIDALNKRFGFEAL
ncbi:MAG TPA: hypothetical protein VH300_17665 [Thermoleophilaceae bacterium]|jgi:hypothetical protein|nr:hypothetical protein [Thermoleophilaceae bacterium]